MPTPPHTIIVRSVPKTQAHLLPTTTVQVQPAGFVSRLVAFVIDLIIVAIGAVLFAGVIDLIVRFFGLAVQVLRLMTANEVTQLTPKALLALDTVSTIVFVPSYFILFWALVGATPGKQILGLKVIDNDERPNVAWLRAIVRFVGYWLSAIPLFMGFWWVLFDQRREAWHDKIARTQVVYIWDVLSEAERRDGSPASGKNPP